MLNFEIQTRTSKQGKEYTVLVFKFLLKGGRVYDMEVFPTAEQKTLLEFIADQEEIAKYLQEIQF